MSHLDEVARRIVSTAPVGCSPPAGAVIGVDRDGVRSYGTAGVRVLGDDAPMTVATSHDIASVTKVVATTTALMRLVSDGQVELDATVRSHVPSFAGGAKDTVTIRDLLGHRGGLWEWQPLYIGAAGAVAAERLAESLPLRYPPGRARHYSDLGFILLGRIVANVAATPLADAIADLVTRPLGLSATRFAHPASEPVAMSALGDHIEITMVDTSTPYPTPYRSSQFDRWRRQPIVGEVCDGNAFHAFDGVSGHAGLFSTMDDLLAWGAALARPAVRDDLWRADVAAEFGAAGPDAEQALGFRRYPVELDGERVTALGHPGFVGCAAGFVPGRGIAVALATNRLLTTATPVPTEAMWRIVLDAAAVAEPG